VSAEARLAELAAQYELSDRAVSSLLAILDLQARDPTASTTVRAPEEAVDRHVADSLVALELAVVREARWIADLGAGAGWPGLALAAALPDARVALVESAVRHCRYLEAAVEAGGLGNAVVVHARAEDWPAGLGAHDLVVARALAALPVVCEYAAPLLTDGGSLVAWKGVVGTAEEDAGARAARELGLEPAGVHPVVPYAGVERRTLHVFRKTAPTPARFPRRPGMAVKRPLG
jgi:16S rRNA (guanine527-N7)-methyltransferase